MEYRRFDQQVLIRLDPDDEVVTTLKQICAAEEIRLGIVTGIGAVKRAELGIFDTRDKKYSTNVWDGMYEIASLSGNITAKDGAPYLHVHAVIANSLTDECHGGHLNQAVISATGELVITVISGRAERVFDNRVGLNLLHFG